MHWQLVTLAVVLLGFAAISRRIEGTRLTAPMLFTAAGLVVGVDALGLVDPGGRRPRGRGLRGGDPHGRPLLGRVADRPHGPCAGRTPRCDCSGSGCRSRSWPGARGLVVLPDLALARGARSLAIVLAPTDAALGSGRRDDQRLPVRIRQGLNVESGLNDGICVPLLLIALAVAVAEEGADRPRPPPTRPRGDRLRRRRRSRSPGVAGSARRPRASRAADRPTWLQVVPSQAPRLAYRLAARARRQRASSPPSSAGIVFGGCAATRRRVTRFIEQAGERARRA